MDNGIHYIKFALLWDGEEVLGYKVIVSGVSFGI